MTLLDPAREGLVAAASALSLAFEVAVVVTVAITAVAAAVRGARTALAGGSWLRRLRLDFVHGLVFALDLFVAADILEMMVTPGFEELSIVGLTVVIRTVLAVALTYEVRQEERGETV